MPTLLEHCEHCQHNIDFLSTFLLSHSNDWAITVMFYTVVHAMEAVLGNQNIHCQNHQSRKTELEKLKNDKLDGVLRLYKMLERKAHDSRYTNYKIYDWEVYRAYNDLLKKIIVWFNSLDYVKSANLNTCDEKKALWFDKYQNKDPECNKCH